MEGREVLSRVVERIRGEGGLTLKTLLDLVDAFGERFERALEALREGRVKRYRFTPVPWEVPFVVGYRKEYLLIPEALYCGCRGAYSRGRSGEICYHLLAYGLGEALGLVEEVEVEARHFEAIIDELKYG
ncbi:MAG: hypothetical protein ACE5GD_01400 [Candidatus Geothermarchaeales archaeon]